MMEGKQKELMEHMKISKSDMTEESCLTIRLIIQSLNKYLFRAYYILVTALNLEILLEKKTDAVCSMGISIILWEKKIF